MTRSNSAAILFILLLASVASKGQTPSTAAKRTTAPVAKLCAACIQAHEEFLASDALNGRGSATHDELLTATYVAAEMRQYGIEPAGDDGGYLQKVPLVRRKFSSPPELQLPSVTFKHGAEVLFLHVAKHVEPGPLQRVEAGAASTPQIQKGAFVLVQSKDNKISSGDIEKVFAAGAGGVLLPETPRYRGHWDAIAKELFSGGFAVANETSEEIGFSGTFIVVGNEALKQLEGVPEGTVIKVAAPMDTPETAFTWNAVGKLRGRDPKLRDSPILLSAHMDHLGTGPAVNADSIYNGADDDASGTTAVLELARVLGAGPKPRRTVLFALFGSEELGGLGSIYWREHPPMPLNQISANLEFEMIGRADAAVAPDTLWLTGWERSNLGPTLAAHGAKLVGDPHPAENFFTRSDNYVLAQKGVVAQTVSSYGLHKDYHQPSDDLAHLDLKHMDEAIASLLRPVMWLVNSNFTPAWKPGGQP
jgi:peptidase M28-like protein